MNQILIEYALVLILMDELIVCVGIDLFSLNVS